MESYCNWTVSRYDEMCILRTRRRYSLQVSRHPENALSAERMEKAGACIAGACIVRRAQDTRVRCGRRE